MTYAASAFTFAFVFLTVVTSGAEASFVGSSVRLEVYAPTLSTLASVPATATASVNSVEFPDVSRFQVPASGFPLVETDIDITSSSVTIDFDNVNYSQFGFAAFNGYVITDANNSIPDFVGVSIDGTATTLGLNSSRVWVTPNQIFINVQGLSFSRATSAKIDIQFASTTSPTQLVAQSIIGSTVTLRWTPPSSGLTLTGYVMDGGLTPGQVLASIPVAGTAPVFSFTAPNGVFYVRMRALAGAQSSGVSNEVRIFVNQAVAPSTPSHLLGLVNGTSVALSWRNSFGGGTPGSVLLDVTGSLSTSLPLGVADTFTFNGVPGGTYTFTVRAVNASGSSASSNAVTLSFPGVCTGVPHTPEDFLAYRVGNTLNLLWNPAAAGPAQTSFVLNVSGAINLALPLATRGISSPVPPGSYTFTVAATNACGTSAATAPQTVVVFPAVSDFAAAGPFAVTVESNTGPIGAFTIFRPATLGQNGLRHPILTWGNGTFVTPAAYAALLRHLASHGFVVIAAVTTNAGTGTEMRQGIDWLVEQHGASSGVFAGKLDIDNIGAFGHSQGGGGAINAGSHPRVKTVIPIQPLPQPQDLNGTMLLLCGSNDLTIHPEAVCRDLVYTPATVPTFFGILNGVDHFAPFGDGGPMRAPVTAWFRGELMGDQTARARFHGSACTYCVDPSWQVARKGF